MTEADKHAILDELMKGARGVVHRHTGDIGRRLDVESYVMLRLALGLLEGPDTNLKPSGYHRNFLQTVYRTFIDGVRESRRHERRQVAKPSDMVGAMLGGEPPEASGEDGEPFRNALTTVILEDLAGSLPDPVDGLVFKLLREGKSDAMVAAGTGLSEGQVKYRRIRMIEHWQRRPDKLRRTYALAHRLVVDQMRASARGKPKRSDMRGGS